MVNRADASPHPAKHAPAEPQHAVNHRVAQERTGLDARCERHAACEHDEPEQHKHRGKQHKLFDPPHRHVIDKGIHQPVVQKEHRQTSRKQVKIKRELILCVQHNLLPACPVPGRAQQKKEQCGAAEPFDARQDRDRITERKKLQFRRIRIPRIFVYRILILLKALLCLRSLRIEAVIDHGDRKARAEKRYAG